MGLFRHEPRPRPRAGDEPADVVLGGGAETRLPTGEFPTPVTRERITGYLVEQGYHYFVDDAGEVGGLWRGCLVYFLLIGPDQQVLQVRGRWHREASIERLGELIAVCNRWNLERIWPKAYVSVLDNGLVNVLAESSTGVEHGLTDAQLARLLDGGLATLSVFFEMLGDEFPDPVRDQP